MFSEPSQTHCVLVFEDNPADARLIEEAFAECDNDCQLTFASSYREAEQLLAMHSFHLLLSDFGTDRESATTFLRLVRIRFPSLPMIVLSGIGDPKPAYEAGANAFIRKDSDLMTFFGKVQGLMHFWIHVAELPTSTEPSGILDTIQRVVVLPLHLRKEVHCDDESIGLITKEAAPG